MTPEAARDFFENLAKFLDSSPPESLYELRAELLECGVDPVQIVASGDKRHLKAAIEQRHPWPS